MVSGPIRKDYSALDFQMVRIVLLEATNRLLAGVPEKLSQYALDQLHLKGVDVCLEASVDEVTEQAVRLKDERSPQKPWCGLLECVAVTYQDRRNCGSIEGDRL